MTIQDIANAIEYVAPRELQESYDNAGLQCGDPRLEVSRVLTCLDVTEATVEEAHRRGCQLVVSHHPLLFRGVKCIDPTRDYISRTLMLAIRYGIGIYAAHTNLDRARGGINDALASMLELTDVQPMSDCGVWGRLPLPMTAAELLSHISQHLGDATLRYNAEAITDPERKLSTLALCGGSAAEFAAEAEQLGADAYLTGEIRYHDFFGHPSILLIEAGHFETEQHAPTLLSHIIQRALPEVECRVADAHHSPCPVYCGKVQP